MALCKKVLSSVFNVPFFPKRPTVNENDHFANMMIAAIIGYCYLHDNIRRPKDLSNFSAFIALISPFSQIPVGWCCVIRCWAQCSTYHFSRKDDVKEKTTILSTLWAAVVPKRFAYLWPKSAWPSSRIVATIKSAHKFELKLIWNKVNFIYYCSLSQSMHIDVSPTEIHPGGAEKLAPKGTVLTVGRMGINTTPAMYMQFSRGLAYVGDRRTDPARNHSGAKTTPERFSLRPLPIPTYYPYSLLPHHTLTCIPYPTARNHSGAKTTPERKPLRSENHSGAKTTPARPVPV